MTKEDILPQDILIFRNGTHVTMDVQTMWILDVFYNDKLKCNKKEEYDIIKIIRPYYETIYEREIEENREQLDKMIKKVKRKIKNEK